MLVVKMYLILLMVRVLSKAILLGVLQANVLVKSVCIVKHIRHSTHLANIPTANILIKGVCVIKHPEGKLCNYSKFKTNFGLEKY
jgi:hypothetical protein